MILRVPDYYQEFSCIADQCKDSCCIGWEIDIDEDSYEFYQSVEGEMGERLQKHMYMTAEGEHSFELQEHGRCPFLNDTNLCDLCIAFGEEALSEVCTEYPRFSIEYGNVLQKCLSLSCEEVGRILFTREDSVHIVDIPYGKLAYLEDNIEDTIENSLERDQIDDSQEDDLVIIKFLEQVQQQAIEILQNRDKHIDNRIKEYLCYINYIQSQLNNYDNCKENEKCKLEVQMLTGTGTEGYVADGRLSLDLTSYDFSKRRFRIFEEMETLDQEWDTAKKELNELFSQEGCEKLYQDYIQSDDFCQKDYEQLMVYFTFRYFMNAVYDFDLLSYAKFAVVCTLVIRDLDLVRYHKNHGSYTRDDRIDVVRIFSKEVEHSEENVEYAREEFMFDDSFTVDALIQQLMM